MSRSSILGTVNEDVNVVTTMSSDFAHKWLAGAVAGIVETLITQPFEVTKTRLQLRPTLSWYEALTLERPKLGLLGSAYSGLNPVLLQTSMKVGIRFAAFEFAKPKFTSSDFVAGTAAGAVEALVWIAPTERLKVLRIGSGAEHPTVWKSVQKLVGTQGVRGLWRGGGATVVRNSLTNGARFWIVGKMNVGLKENSSVPAEWRAGLSGFFAGFVTTVLNNPVDVVKTRMSADCVGDERIYSSNWQCIKVVFKNEGLMGFTRGMSARLMKISIGQAVIFTVYERVTKILKR